MRDCNCMCLPFGRSPWGVSGQPAAKPFSGVVAGNAQRSAPRKGREMILRIDRLGDRAAAAVRSRSGRRRRRPGAAGRQVRRDVDLAELHVPVVQLPRAAGRAAVLRPGLRASPTEEFGHVELVAATINTMLTGATPGRRRHARPSAALAGAEGRRQPAPLPRRRPGRAAAELAGAARGTATTSSPPATSSRT